MGASLASPHQSTVLTPITKTIFKFQSRQTSKQWSAQVNGQARRAVHYIFFCSHFFLAKIIIPSSSHGIQKIEAINQNIHYTLSIRFTPTMNHLFTGKKFVFIIMWSSISSINSLFVFLLYNPTKTKIRKKRMNKFYNLANLFLHYKRLSSWVGFI